jgi:hypothetical protein
MRRAACSDRHRAFPPRDAIRFLSKPDNRPARARPPLRPSLLAISDVFMNTILLGAKHKYDREQPTS